MHLQYAHDHLVTVWFPLKSIIWRKILECFHQKPLKRALDIINVSCLTSLYCSKEVKC